MNEETLMQVFSFEFYEISKNIFLTEHLHWFCFIAAFRFLTIINF